VGAAAVQRLVPGVASTCCLPRQPTVLCVGVQMSHSLHTGQPSNSVLLLHFQSLQCTSADTCKHLCRQAQLRPLEDVARHLQAAKVVLYSQRLAVVVVLCRHLLSPTSWVQNHMHLVQAGCMDTLHPRLGFLVRIDSLSVAHVFIAWLLLFQKLSMSVLISFRSPGFGLQLT
jgi:hypothetical protein